MPTLAQVNERKRQIEAVTTLAVRDLTDVWPTLDLEDAARLQAQMIDLLPLIGDEYANTLGVTSADWYEELRAEAVGGRYTARIGELPREGQYRALAGWAAQPLYENAGDYLRALTRAAGGLSRLIRQTGRDTIIENVRQDSRAVRYARATAPGACAFCAMLATRGAVYSEETVRDGGLGGPKWRFKTHDWCNCEPVPVFVGDDLERPSYYDKYEAAYKEAVKRVGNRRDTKAILAAMREVMGSH